MGAELLVICTNSGHARARALQEAAGIPVVHIADAVGAEMQRRGIRKAGLLGTIATMQGTFLQRASAPEPGISKLWFLLPMFKRECITLRLRKLLAASALKVRDGDLANIADELCSDGVILGCTELPLLLTPARRQMLPVLNTLSLHVDAIVERGNHRRIKCSEARNREYSFNEFAERQNLWPDTRGHHFLCFAAWTECHRGSARGVRMA